MATLPIRLFGLFLLTMAITVSSCQALFPRSDVGNAPQQMSPGSFTDGR